MTPGSGIGASEDITRLPGSTLPSSRSKAARRMMRIRAPPQRRLAKRFGICTFVPHSNLLSQKEASRARLCSRRHRSGGGNFAAFGTVSEVIGETYAFKTSRLGNASEILDDNVVRLDLRKPWELVHSSLRRSSLQVWRKLWRAVDERDVKASMRESPKPHLAKACAVSTPQPSTADPSRPSLRNWDQTSTHERPKSCIYPFIVASAP